ncbi:hypothetical protein Enr17x_01960 [Gimesia fumaroli]|uniref:DUF692 domain-containing protein n=1 Tax=Gimesia fumaroli TaxID=2527976 RepID=A0A518I541_9PLAN|nr:hypothetical protein Enr17x_01960 [Gimesia fumaroli]
MVDAEAVEVTDNNEMIEVPLIGVGFRKPFADWVLSNPTELDCVEVTAEHFFDSDTSVLSQLASDYLVSVHGLGLSLGTPGPLDNSTLSQFQRVADHANAKWITEHIAFTKTDDVDLGHLNPLPMTESSLIILADHAREVMDRCQRPLLLENITSYLRIPGDYTEPEFLNRLCERAGSGLLLDVTNLLINGQNHCFDPVKWLHEVDPDFIRQVHIVGYSIQNGIYHDRHCEPIQDNLYDLLSEVVRYAPVEAVILERDMAIPASTDLAAELLRLEETCERARND